MYILSLVVMNGYGNLDIYNNNILGTVYVSRERSVSIHGSGWTIVCF